MAIASDKYIHFLIDTNGSPQRCRVSFGALAMLEGYEIPYVHRDLSMRIFIRHRRVIEAIARRKISNIKLPAEWILITPEDLDLTP